ncbi:hypothetical protein L1987_73038 [Smallanthus sonchifolius]|uniref:Uncharacterized protein n=2 Tax=Smallanthus sonchifolius TaxID=185202 RepID=A0ACB9AXJ6_9ASTR|nr:hypothetical protein L1987_73037 [Smallanthus sonchifolius]KAI3714436.1 hypothetical protein L1987_73038 [Smallanthus sonchifolius]
MHALIWNTYMIYVNEEAHVTTTHTYDMYATTLSFPSFFPQNVTTTSIFRLNFSFGNLSKSARQSPSRCWAARRQVRYDDEDENDQEYGHNEEIDILEFYTQVAKEEALLVKAVVDNQQLQLLIFKGFSSSLSSGTCFDPTKSILPARAVIQCIDRVKGPFDPSNIDYIEKNLQVEAFKTLVQKIKHVRSNLQS